MYKISKIKNKYVVKCNYFLSKIEMSFSLYGVARYVKNVHRILINNYSYTTYT